MSQVEGKPTPWSDNRSVSYNLQQNRDWLRKQEKGKSVQDNPGIMVRALNQLFRAMEESTESFYKVYWVRIENIFGDFFWGEYNVNRMEQKSTFAILSIFEVSMLFYNICGWCLHTVLGGTISGQSLLQLINNCYAQVRLLHHLAFLPKWAKHDEYICGMWEQPLDEWTNTPVHWNHPHGMWWLNSSEQYHGSGDQVLPV